MRFLKNEYYHVYNRGNNQQRIFFSNGNYLFFLKKIEVQLLPYSDIIAYCLMPNHFHFLLRANEEGLKKRSAYGGKPMQELAYRVGILLSSYSQAINIQNKTTGSLFQQRTKAKVLHELTDGIRESYFEYCFHYIHQNPAVARLVKNVADWPYSSYPYYIEQGDDSLCDKKIFYTLTGMTAENIRKKTLERIEEKVIKKLFE